MKKLSILLFAFLAVATWSCQDDDEELFIGQPSAADIQLSPMSVAFEVTENNLNQLADRFSWSVVEFSTPVQINYDLQLDFAGNDFANAQSLTTTTATNFAITYGDLNDFVVAMGAEPAVANNMEMRIVASPIDPSAGTFESNIVPLTITPFAAYLFTDLYLVGNATAPGWSNNNENPALFRDANNEDIFYYTGYFDRASASATDGQFKVLTDLGQWQPQYGTENGVVGLNDGTGGGDPLEFQVPSSGYFDFVIDISGVDNDNPGGNFSITPNTTAASAPMYNSIGFIGTARTGDATGWNEDTDMVQSSFDPHQWSARNVTLFSGEIKFRADNDWANNWGATDEFSGQANLGSPDNMPIGAGVYDIFFNDIDGRYIFIPVM